MLSHDGADQVETAAALARARAAVAALDEPASKFLDGMRSAVRQAEAALEQQPRGRWAWSLPDKSKYLSSLPAESSKRPTRGEAYDALANLKAVAFPAVSATDRSRRFIMSKRPKTAAAVAAAAHEDERGAPAGARLAQRASSRCDAALLAYINAVQPRCAASLACACVHTYMCAVLPR